MRCKILLHCEITLGRVASTTISASTQLNRSINPFTAEELPMSTPFAIADYVDFSKRMLAPATKFSEVAIKTLEQVARYQYELAGDYLNFGIEQLQSASKTKDVSELVSKQSELASNLVEKLTKRSQDLTKIAADAQAGFTKWIDETAATKLA